MQLSTATMRILLVIKYTTRTNANSCHVSTPLQQIWEKSMACCMSWNIRQWHHKYEWRNFQIPRKPGVAALGGIPLSALRCHTTTYYYYYNHHHVTFISIYTTQTTAPSNDHNHLLRYLTMHEPEHVNRNGTSSVHHKSVPHNNIYIHGFIILWLAMLNTTNTIISK